MNLHLEGKTALITGASSFGLGRAIALGLVREGASIAITARRGDLLRERAREIGDISGREAIVIEADLYDPDTPDWLAGRATQQLGQVDILINAAGGSRPTTLDAPSAVWEEAMLLNFLCLRSLTHALVPGMVASHWGRVINLTGSSEPHIVNGANAAKAAVHAWAKGLSRQVARDGVTVNCIQPGRITSEQMLRMHPTEERRREFTSDVPLGRFGNPEELADLAVFLTSPRASYITGTVIPVDGGLSRFAF